MSDVTSFPRYTAGERRGVFVYRVRTYVVCHVYVLCELIPSVPGTPLVEIRYI